MAKVIFRNISKTFKGEKGKEIKAVADFNLEVNDRELVVIAGPSGCGKSTALRMTAGLEKITAGEIFIGDRLVNDVPPKDRDLAMVFQNCALYPHLTVFDNLAFGLKLRKFPKAEIARRVREAATILGIESCLDRKPRELSSGQCQRVAIARAIVRQPEVFLFDEPFLNLDAEMRPGMRTEILKLHQRLGATMIYATQDPVEAMTLGDRIVVMKEGVIEQVGTPLALYKEPANLFVAGFFGCPAMNFVHGRLKESGGALIFKEKDGGMVECRLGDRPAAAAYAGLEVVMGIRPEDIDVVLDGEKGGGRFQALVDIVEMTGSWTNVYLQTGAHTLVSRSAGSFGREEVGHRIQFTIDLDNALLFDPATTRRIA